MCFGGQGNQSRAAQRDSTRTLFEDPRDRQQFVKKVLLLVLIQLVIIFGTSLIVLISEELQQWMFKHFEIFFLLSLGYLVFMIILCCCSRLLLHFPTNYIFLFIYTFLMAGIIGFIAAFYEPALFAKAFAGTTGIVFVVALIAWLAPVDFTKFTPYLCVITLALVVFGIIFFIFPSKLMYNIYCGAAVLIFSVWLIIDLQMMIGGNHSMSLGPDDYCLGAILITGDILTIFLHLLQWLND